MKLRIQNSDRRIRIGVCGSDRGVGVSQMCLILCEYLKEVRQIHAVIVDCSESKQLSKAGFIKHLQVISEEVWKNKEEYKYLIMDFGCRYESVKREFAYCDYKIIVGSILPWKAANLDRLISKCKQDGILRQELTIVFLSGSEKLQYSFEKTMQQDLYRMPFVRDPFVIDQKSYGFLQTILPI